MVDFNYAFSFKNVHEWDLGEIMDHETHKMLQGFSESNLHLDRNSRVSECENAIKFLEAKFKKLEMICKNIPAHYVMPMGVKKKVNEIACGRCNQAEERANSLAKKYEALKAHNEKRFENSVNMKKAHYDKMMLVDSEHGFLLKRIVAIYGNKALIDLMNHVENPSLTPERLEQWSKVKPHF